MTELTDDEMIQRINVVREKYGALIRRQPGWWGLGTGNLVDAVGERTGPLGIIISVEKILDQSTLPPEDRIPDCLDGVPVQFDESPPPVGHGRHGR